MFSWGGDSVVFITSNAETPGNVADWRASPENSGIFIYDLNAQQTYPVFNDITKMERQPIFMGYQLKVIPPPPQGSIVLSDDSIDFDTVIIGEDSTISITVANPTVNGVSIAVGLSPNDAFLVTAAPDTLAGEATGTITVRFIPTAAVEETASIAITYAIDSTKTLFVRGVGKVKPADTTGSDRR